MINGRCAFETEEKRRSVVQLWARRNAATCEPESVLFVIRKFTSQGPRKPGELHRVSKAQFSLSTAAVLYTLRGQRTHPSTEEDVMTTLNWCAALGAVLGASIAYAQVEAPVMGQRQAAQERRITHGVTRGVLTEQEANRLVHQQAQMGKVKDQIGSGGRVTRSERSTLPKAQDRASRQSAPEKDNRAAVPR
jgi:hypothetical protein